MITNLYEQLWDNILKVEEYWKQEQKLSIPASFEKDVLDILNENKDIPPKIITFIWNFVFRKVIKRFNLDSLTLELKTRIPNDQELQKVLIALNKSLEVYV